MLDPCPYPTPFRITSTRPGDVAMIHDLTRGERGGPSNTFADLRAAGGVCLDLRKRATGTLSVVDGLGNEVPGDAWFPALMAIRLGVEPR